MLQIQETDLSSPQHAEAFIRLLDIYARDPMGGGQALSDFAQDNLIACIRQRQDAVIVLAFQDEHPAGLINCFEGFSTFSCRPLLNIHDVIVAPAFRNRGIATKMLQHVEQIALQRGCCKLTLEVLDNNAIAGNTYRKFGFHDYQLDPKFGKALFWEKKL